MDKYIKPIVKALGSGVSAAVPTAILVAPNGVTLVEGLMILGAFLGGAGFTYMLPANKPYQAPPAP